ncbi:bile acid:sodium symporter [Mycolicibacterium hippocampi]|uniref:Putative sodium-dependent transporter n=1 Tax=Mycolicibacterium hippocampi TaxID=659824 RepID=A0A850PLI5_9MYCO|nr:bile acid:sodium symporter [Mycolicibacterium hippocampi]NVN49010.1 putative sodium-dependent transporter [Mycolicibacterium hippocampi]
MSNSSVTVTMERHQIAIYLGGLAAGAAAGLAWPAGGPTWEAAIYPVLGALLYATFLQVPFTKLTAAFRDGRFLGAVLLVNFVVVPLVVAGLTLVVSLQQAVLLGVLLTLLTPCIDYVIVFSGLAGGDSQRLLAAAPLLMLAQMATLPLLLWLFVGPELADIVEVGPFVEAFLVLIVLPLALAWATEALSNRHRIGYAISAAMTTAMVPLMTATLFVVVASQFPKIADQSDQVLTVVPIYAAFLVIMAGVGMVAAKLLRLDSPRSRALIFSGATRNSLVVLPLALALPDAYAVTAIIVVTQTLVELLGMIIYVRLIPRLTPALPDNA